MSKYFLANFDDFGVDLKTINGCIGENLAGFAGSCSGSQPDDGNILHIAFLVGSIIEKWRGKDSLPGTVEIVLTGFIDGMDPLTVVQTQQHVSILVEHLDVVVGRLFFVDQSG